MIICKRWATPDNNNNRGDKGEGTRVTGVTRGDGTERGDEGKGEGGEEILANTGTQTDQSKVVQDVLANLKSKCFNNKDEICIHHQ